MTDHQHCASAIEVSESQLHNDFLYTKTLLLDMINYGGKSIINTLEIVTP